MSEVLTQLKLAEIAKSQKEIVKELKDLNTNLDRIAKVLEKSTII